MKFDKDTLVFIVICAVILIAGRPLARSFGLIPPDQEKDVSIAVWAAENKPQEPFRVLKNGQMTLTFKPEEGKINRISFPKYLDATKQYPIDLYQGLTGVGAFSVFDRTSKWELVKIEADRVDEAAGTYTLTRRMRAAGGEEFLLTQEWKLAGDYQIHCRVSFRNLADRPLLFPALTVNGGDLAPWAMYSGDAVRIPSHRMDLLTANGKYMDIKAGLKEENPDFFLVPPPSVVWAGIGNKYFSTILTAEQPFVLYQNRFWYCGLKEKNVIAEVGAQYPNFQLAANEMKSYDFRAYYGPKVISLLKKFDGSTARMMHLAWGPLDYLARLLLWVLVALHGVVGSYGVSIIILTLMVRILFYPITAKANASMRKMQALQPKMKEIREKYKDNAQLQYAKMQELQRAEGVNPFGGCLPILLQIPVFFALYATLDGAVELRQVPFLWAKDLAAADTVLTIPLYFFNLPINPLVLIMTGLMVVQQHMTPMSIDPMQKKMMLMMPVIMLLFLYDLPSGLTLYWSVSNFFSIIQMRLQRRHYNDHEAKPAGVSGK
ncbi:MAG: membrane protein insertase YidC [Lentisphaeria bacterium]|nr:membrane protein insertase YidC [Lentisphaeria bacterium]